MKTVRRLAAAAGLAAVILAAQVAAAQVLQQVPPEALVVVKIANLKQTSDKVAVLAERFGLAQMVPPLADPLASLQEETKLTNGVNTAGEAAIVFLDPDKTGAKGRGAESQSMLLLVPVSDYKAFITNFSKPTEETDQPAADAAANAKPAPPTTDANGISTVAFPSSFEKAFVKQWGDYAAISPLQSAVAAKGAGLSVQGITAKAVEANDLVVYANMPAIKAKVLPRLQASRKRIMAEMTRAMDANPQNKAFAPVANIFMTRALDGAEQLLTDARSAAYGVTLSKDGIRTTLLGEFAPESPFGKSVADVKNTDQPMTAGLPQGKYLFYGGLAWDGKTVAEAFDRLTGEARTELAAGDAKTAPFAKLIDAYKQLFAATNSMTFGMVAPTGAIGQESLIQVVAVTTGDAKAIVDANKTIFNLQSDVMKATDDPNNKVTVTYTANAKQIAGVPFDQFTTTFDMKPRTPQEMQAAQAIKMMYGPSGMSGFIGSIDDQQVVSGVGVPDALLEKTVAAAKANENALASAKGLQLVQQNLPKQRVAAFYVPVDQIVMTGANYAKQFGMPINLQLPPGLAPVGMTISTEQSAARLDAYIPAQTVQSLIAAGMQAFMGMQGGMAPGGPGGL